MEGVICQSHRQEKYIPPTAIQCEKMIENATKRLNVNRKLLKSCKKKIDERNSTESHYAYLADQEGKVSY